MIPEEYAERIKRLSPLRVILRISSSGIEGLVEHSFHMGYDPSRILLLWSGSSVDNIFGHTWDLDAIEDSEAIKARMESSSSLVIVDPLAEDSPVEIDWDYWFRSSCKFDKRNALFKLKPGQPLDYYEKLRHE